MRDYPDDGHNATLCCVEPRCRWQVRVTVGEERDGALTLPATFKPPALCPNHLAGQLFLCLDVAPLEDEEPVCALCGCSEFDACADDGSGVPCHWASLDPPLCSACAGAPAMVKP